MSFRPSRVRLLLVGESPPANGKFFYVKSAMTTHTARAFEKAHRRGFRDNGEFLAYFSQHECFLDDLSHSPVDDLPKSRREECLKAGVSGLAVRIRELNPDVIAIVLKKIERYVLEAIALSGRQPVVRVLTFPGNGHQGKYVTQLSEIVSAHVPRELGRVGSTDLDGRI